MNKDFRIAVDYFEHHKVKKLERRLGETGLVCHLRLLAYAARHRPSGEFSGMDPEDIEIAAGWAGEPGALHQALLDLRLIEVLEGSATRIHDWAEHNPFASEAEDRSGQGRLSRLAQVNPKARAELERLGQTAISPEEYRRWKTWAPTWAPSGATPGQPQVAPGLAPAPAPVPSPAPAAKTSRPHDWAGFLSLWQVYPCKQAQAEAFAEYCRLKDQNRLETTAVMRDKIIELAASDCRWLRGVVPSLANFLRGARWNDQAFVAPAPPVDDALGRIASEVRATSPPRVPT